MRKNKSIYATYIAVGVLSFTAFFGGMSHFALAAVDAYPTTQTPFTGLTTTGFTYPIIYLVCSSDDNTYRQSSSLSGSGYVNNINKGGSYAIYFWQNDPGLSGTDSDCETVPAQGLVLGTLYYSSDSNGVVGPYTFTSSYVENVFNTRFVSISSPVDGFVSTSTSITFSGTVYLSSNYAASTTGSFVSVLLTPRGFGSSTPRIINIPFSGFDSVVSFSTTTTVENNMRYQWDATIFCARTYDWYNCDSSGNSAGVELNPSFGFFQFTTGSFDPTGGKPFDLSSCNLLSGFDAGQCIQNLIVLNNPTLDFQISSLKSSFSSAFPFGYITRFISILSSLSSVEPPALSYTFGSSSPSVLQGKTYSVQLYDYLGTTSPLSQIRTDDGQNKSVWDVIDPPITTLTAIMVLVVLLEDLMKFGIGRLEKDVDRREGNKKMFQRSTTNQINPVWDKRKSKWES